MDVYLIDEAKNITFQFPVNPLSELSKPKEKKFITADIIDFGEVDISDKGKKITEISFNSFFPLYYDSYCRYTALAKPLDSSDKIQGWIDSDTTLRLLITDFNINELVKISKFTPQIKGGEVGDIYFSISFRTFRELKIQTVNNATTVNLGGLENNRATQKSEFAAGDIVTVTASALNVRSGPGKDEDIIGSVFKGDKLEIYRIHGNWADCYWGNHGCWIDLDYVTK